MTDASEAMAQAVGRAMGKSAALLQAAAETGDAEAQFALALLYLLGRGVEKNLVEAFRLFGLAQAAGDEQAAAFRDMAAEQLAREQVSQQQMQEAAAHVLKDAQRKQKFPKPHIVKSD